MHSIFRQTRKDAFSLVELSIVLVILGLLTGGILAGKSLIRAAELRKVVEERSRFITAARSFRDKYFYLPGDMNNATSFWGADASCPGTPANTTPKTATCNGDGNGQIISAVGWPAESLRFWQQLANAGMIEGSYSGAVATGDTTWRNEQGEVSPGVNVPLTAASNGGGWMVAYLVKTSTDSWFFAGEYGNYLTVGSTPIYNAGAGSNHFAGPAFKPEEAWNIDTKLDDGLPAIGTVLANYVTKPVGPDVNCTTTIVPATAAYRLSDSAAYCNLIFARAF